MNVFVPLAADDPSGIIFQIIFVLVMIIAWVVRAIAAAREKRAGGAVSPRPDRRPPPTPGLSRGETVAMPPDVVYGTRRLKHPPRPSDTGRRERAAEAPLPPTRPTTGRSPGSRRGADRSRARASMVQELTASSDAAEARVRDAVRARQAALERLGVARIPFGLRARTRMGVLWAEVLGPPRALKGPHRAPTFERRR